MTIAGWFLFISLSLIALLVGLFVAFVIENIAGKIVSIIVALLVILGLFLVCAGTSKILHPASGP